jgi:uncharacterized phage-associated protein
MYNVLLVSKYIINHCNQRDMPISNLKLQKLLYFVQAEFLVSTGNACFPEEIEAWDFGPVVPEAYHKYKVFGSLNIPAMGHTMEFEIAEQARRLIDGIVDALAQYPASQLVEITHRQRPWKAVYSPYTRNVISKASIKEFFT